MDTIRIDIQPEGAPSEPVNWWAYVSGYGLDWMKGFDTIDEAIEGAHAYIKGNLSEGG